MTTTPTIRPGDKKVATTLAGGHHSHDDVETHYSGLERLECFACYEGLVYIGYLEMTEEGEEVEVIEAVPCRRCAESR